MANTRQYNLDDFNAYIRQFESSGGNATALNKKSGAYGTYQHLPSTTRKAAKALDKSVKYLKTPEGQEEAQNWLLTENMGELKRRGIPVNPTTMYGIHQQGGKVYSKMYKGEDLSDKEKDLIVSNTPEQFRTGDPIKDWHSKYGDNVVPADTSATTTPFAPQDILAQTEATPRDITFADTQVDTARKQAMENTMNELFQMPIGQSPNPTIPYGDGNIGLRQLTPTRLGLGRI